MVQQNGKPLYKTDHRAFAPRAGFAWDVTGKGTTVLRAGMGVSYDTPQVDDLIAYGSAQASTMFPPDLRSLTRMAASHLRLPMPRRRQVRPGYCSVQRIELGLQHLAQLPRRPCRCGPRLHRWDRCVGVRQRPGAGGKWYHAVTMQSSREVREFASISHVHLDNWYSARFYG